MKNYFKYLVAILACLMSIDLQAQVQQWQDIHQVKKRETIFGIAKNYGVTIEEILNANPEMKQKGYELKKGDWVFVPYSKEGDKKAPARQQTPDQPQPASKPAAAKPNVINSVRVGLMLPLHNNDGDGKRMIEYYRGLLMAFNDLKTKGINTEVHAWNVPIDADVRTTLKEPSAANLDIIIGPLYSNMVKPMADFCKQHDIKLFIPFSISGNDVASCDKILQVYQTQADLNAKTISAFLERFQKGYHPVFIDCNDAGSDKGAFTSSLRKTLDVSGMKYNLTNLNTPMENFRKAFSTTEPNVVVLNTARSPQLNRTFAKLDSLQAVANAKVTLYGYTEWLMYQKYDEENFFKYNTYIPTTFYYNPAADATEALEQQYERQYGAKMMEEYIPRFAISGYDHGMYLIKGFSQYGKLFTGVDSQMDYKPLQTRLSFKRVGGAGGYQNVNFQLIHFKTDRTMESLTY